MIGKSIPTSLKASNFFIAVAEVPAMHKSSNIFSGTNSCKPSNPFFLYSSLMIFTSSEYPVDCKNSR